MIWTAVVVALVAAAAYFFVIIPQDQAGSIATEGEMNVGGDQEAPGPETVPNDTVAGSVTGGADVEVDMTPTSATISYDGSKYTPSSVTIKKGGTVTWKNTSGGSMWVASASHPSHTVYDGTSRQEHCAATIVTAFDQCKGESGDYSFTFTKAGKWGYHDHINASAFGSVTVVE